MTSAYAASDWARRAARILSGRGGDGWDVRLAEAGDLTAITDLERAGYPGISESEASFIAKANAGVLVVASVGPSIAGYGLALPSSGAPLPLDAVPEQFQPAGRRPMTLHVHDVCVGSQFRGRGIATGLMAGFADLATSLGMTGMTAIAVNGAEALWCSIGWSLTAGEPPAGYPAGSLPIHRDLAPAT